jgi:hypothetical protein
MLYILVATIAIRNLVLLVLPMLCPGERGGLLNIGREYSPLRTELVAKEFRMEQTSESLLSFWELNVIL